MSVGKPKWKRDRCKPLGAPGLPRPGRKKMTLAELAGLEALVAEKNRKKKKPAEDKDKSNA